MIFLFERQWLAVDVLRRRNAAGEAENNQEGGESYAFHDGKHLGTSDTGLMCDESKLFNTLSHYDLNFKNRYIKRLMNNVYSPENDPAIDVYGST